MPEVYIFITNVKGTYFKDGITDENGVFIAYVDKEALSSGLIAYAKKGSINIGNIVLSPSETYYILHANAMTLHVTVTDEVDGDSLNWYELVVSWEDPAYGTLSESFLMYGNGIYANATGIPLADSEVELKVEVVKFSQVLYTTTLIASLENNYLMINVSHMPDLTVKVVDKYYNPIFNATVTLVKDNFECTEYTNDEGIVCFKGLPRGMYYVHARFEEHSTSKRIWVEEDDMLVELRLYRVIVEAQTPTKPIKTTTSKASKPTVTPTTTVHEGPTYGGPFKTSLKKQTVTLEISIPTHTPIETTVRKKAPTVLIVGKETLTTYITTATPIGEGVVEATLTIPPGTYRVMVLGELGKPIAEIPLTIKPETTETRVIVVKGEGAQLPTSLLAIIVIIALVVVVLFISISRFRRSL